jgi:predicted RNA-binding Zn-ribbon protein involved in translation (DUF1610 family)
MTNAELIKALRHCVERNCTDCRYDCQYVEQDTGACLHEYLISDAADALEAAEQRLAELEAQLPKEGEWIELSDRNERKYSHICSNCHRFNIHEGEIEFYHYCPNCGAKMDGADGERRTDGID